MIVASDSTVRVIAPERQPAGLSASGVAVPCVPHRTGSRGADSGCCGRLGVHPIPTQRLHGVLRGRRQWASLSLSPLAMFVGIAIALTGALSAAEAPTEPTAATTAAKAATSAAASSVPASPLSPDEALAQFVIEPGYRIELVAAEPQVVDPVSAQFDAAGQLWVVEMRDYPYGPAAGEAPQSQIVRLTDRDGDGRFETSQVFADQLLFVTGLLPYRDGLIVTLAGEIAFLADRDHDGRAEFRETWFTGFATENSQLRANHPTFGPDGWIYVANGLRGGKVIATRPAWKSDRAPLEITGFDFRFHPETGEFGPVTGHGQFGMTIDSFGRRYVCSNRNPCQQIVFEDRYLTSNPRYAPRQVMVDVCAPAETSRLFPLSSAWTTSALHANQFTAACGVHVYEGDAFPTEMHGAAFTCDPTGSLVHMERVAPLGAVQRGTPLAADREFLASRDAWFRPVDLTVGPDGGLYIVDMYRAVIEHPDWMPAELKTRKDLLWGEDRGRIWRVVPKAFDRQTARRALSEAADQPADLSSATPSMLVAQLHDRNGWHRRTAQRLLAEHPAADVRAALGAVGHSAATSELSPAARAAHLFATAHAGGMTVELLQTALSNPSTEVRRVALLLSEPLLKDNAELWTAVSSLADDPDDAVRLQLLLTVSRVATIRQLAELVPLVVQQPIRDEWLSSAVLIAARETVTAAVFQAVDRLPNDRLTAGHLELAFSLSQGLASDAMQVSTLADWFDAADRTPPASPSTPLEPTASPSAATADEQRRWQWIWGVLRGTSAGLVRRGVGFNEFVSLPPSRASAVDQWLQAAWKSSTNAELPLTVRIAAIDTLPLLARDEFVSTLLTLALEDPVMEIRLASFAALIRTSSPDLAAALIERFPSAEPASRRAILDVLLSNEPRTERLIAALEQGVIRPAELDATRQGRLQQVRQPELRERAAKVLSAGVSSDRQAVLAAYEPSLKVDADPRRGRIVFEKQCVSCHRVGGIGVNVGPDVADNYARTPAMLLLAILDPNRAVDNNSFGYALVTAEGQTHTGLLVASTSSSVTLRMPEGKEVTVLRSDIEELRSTGLSLMPVGFEKSIPPQEMADLIAFLKHWRYLDNNIPLESTAGGP
jgi:putative membrane-bound dehydrogenase-like protein